MEEIKHWWELDLVFYVVVKLNLFLEEEEDRREKDKLYYWLMQRKALLHRPHVALMQWVSCVYVDPLYTDVVRLFQIHRLQIQWGSSGYYSQVSAQMWIAVNYDIFSKWTLPFKSDKNKFDHFYYLIIL